MSRKYDVRICSCGRIHMIKSEKINTALEHNKNLLLVCGGCGKAVLIGADVVPSMYRGKRCYNMYSSVLSPCTDISIKPEDFESVDSKKGIEEIIYSHGLKVPMMTGQYATDYFNGIFSDRWYPDFYKIQRNDITVNEVMEFINQYTHDRKTVNMSRFINETPEDMLEEISHYMIDGFNWAGTKWETSYNSQTDWTSK